MNEIRKKKQTDGIRRHISEERENRRILPKNFSWMGAKKENAASPYNSISKSDNGLKKENGGLLPSEAELVITEVVDVHGEKKSANKVLRLTNATADFLSKVKRFSFLSNGVKDMPEKAEEVQPNGPRLSWDNRRMITWWIAGGCAVIVIFIILLSTTFARLTVTIKPKVVDMPVENVSIVLDSASSKANLIERIIPSERLEFTRTYSEEFPTSGREFIEERARGIAKVYNRFSSFPQSLVATTRFVTESGSLYRLSKGVVIPGAKIEQGKIVPNYIEVELVADKTGIESNLDGEITLKIPGFKGTPKYEGFYAVVSSGFSGGFRGETRVITKNDLNKAEEAVTKRVNEELQHEMLSKIPKDLKLIESLREIQIIKLEIPREKTRGEHFTAVIHARGRVIVFREENIFTFLKETLLKNDKTKAVIPGVGNISYQVKSVDFDKGKASMNVKGNVKIKSVILKEEITGIVREKKEGSIIEILKGREDLASFKLTFFPFWLSRAPGEDRKIRVAVEE